MDLTLKLPLMMCRKQFLTIPILVFLPFWMLNAQCLAGDCWQGTGTMLYPSGSKYVGQFVDGKHHGGGTLFYADGSRYQGAWKNGKMEGSGAETLPDGTLRKGTWKNGRLVSHQSEQLEAKGNGPVQQMGCISGDCLNGKGYYMFATGAVYIGEFLNGEIHGYGTCYYPNGTIYKGYWAHRFPDGQGTKTYEDGSKRIGFWKKGQPVDEFGNFVDDQKDIVLMEKEDPTIQTGCLLGNCMNGNGTYAYVDGSRYEGQFLNEKPHHQGVFSYASGDRYEGELAEGLPHGLGKMVHHNGEVSEGLWQEGNYQGPAEQFAESNKNGCLSGDCQSGEGQYRFENGSVYNGTFKNYLPHGNGS